MKLYTQYAGCGVIRVDEFTVFLPRLVGNDLALNDYETREILEFVIEKMCHEIYEHLAYLDIHGKYHINTNGLHEIEEAFSGGQIKIDPESVICKQTEKYKYTGSICHKWCIDFEVDSVPDLDFSKLRTN